MAEKKEVKVEVKKELKPDPNCPNCKGAGFVEVVGIGKIPCTCKYH